MISKIILENFKKFRKFELDLGNLTVLTGLNGSGKSTVIQSLLLSYQASLVGRNKVPLVAAPGLDLGRASDVLCVDSPNSQITIAIESDHQYQWVFDTGNSGDEPFLDVVSSPDQPPAPFGESGQRFTFLSAERLGPRTSHPINHLAPNEISIGEDGRYAAHILATHDRQEVPEELRHPGAGTIKTLGAQTEAWMSQLVGPVQFEAALIPRTSMATLRVRTPGNMGEWMLPTNTGFGISYSLPIIISGLIASSGGLMIVDSPEAHLHPSAQSAIGVFLAAVANSGVQVVVETHSDHVLNGIRRAVAVEKKICETDVNIYFFGDEGEIKLKIDENGKIDSWPTGFFDQMDVDLNKIINSRRA
ncbi:AAA family ATPase [Rhodococcus qingshengii]|uniref:AAA family ATPase n=1 Tax=Rhodococcus qingshengii TaxID=334542 RepID=UPI0022B4018A|nr:DUF3696 domain-containing protein [Rhodococcus qingshengii]MCZ4618455.1 DUF3696 domain-containing protein [Rhodococcus qingshengii]